MSVNYIKGVCFKLLLLIFQGAYPEFSGWFESLKIIRALSSAGSEHPALAGGSLGSKKKLYNRALSSAGSEHPALAGGSSGS